VVFWGLSAGFKFFGFGLAGVTRTQVFGDFKTKKKKKRKKEKKRQGVGGVIWVVYLLFFFCGTGGFS